MTIKSQVPPRETDPDLLPTSAKEVMSEVLKFGEELAKKVPAEIKNTVIAEIAQVMYKIEEKAYATHAFAYGEKSGREEKEENEVTGNVDVMNTVFDASQMKEIQGMCMEVARNTKTLLISICEPQVIELQRMVWEIGNAIIDSVGISPEYDGIAYDAIVSQIALICKRIADHHNNSGKQVTEMEKREILITLLLIHESAQRMGTESILQEARLSR